MAERIVVELLDESDDLIGYAVCVSDADGYRLEPEVFSTRSGAHGASEPVDRADRYARLMSVPIGGARSLLSEWRTEWRRNQPSKGDA